MKTLSIKKALKDYALRAEQLRLYKAHLNNVAPIVFNEAKPLPLAIGVHNLLRITKPKGIGTQTVRIFLHQWCQRPEYQKCLRAGAPRYMPNGMQKGVVKPEEVWKCIRKARHKDGRSRPVECSQTPEKGGSSNVCK